MARPPLRESLAYVLLVAVWGSTWLFISIAVDGVGPMAAVAWRVAIAGPVLLGLALALGRPLPWRGPDRALSLFVGVSFAGNFGFLYWAETVLPSGLSAVLFAGFPLMVGFLAWAWAREPFPPRRIAGGLLAIGGMVVLFRDDIALGGATVWHALAVVAAAASASVNTVAVRVHKRPVDPIAINAVGSLLALPLVLAVALLRGEDMVPAPDLRTWGSLLYLAIAGSVVAFIAYFWLLRRMPAASVATTSLVTPLVATALGALVLDEPLTVGYAAGAALILCGVGLVLLPGRRLAPQPVPATGK